MAAENKDIDRISAIKIRGINQIHAHVKEKLFFLCRKAITNRFSARLNAPFTQAFYATHFKETK
jgi:hypothetical protein